LQAWLETQGTDVEIPYGKALVSLIPPVAVRLRRDISTFVRLISAHALLHQANRPRNAEGWVVATLDDYEAVRELVHDIMAVGVDLKVSDELRETVAAVEYLLGPRDGKRRVQLPTISYSELGRQLGSGVDAAKRRALDAVSRGYL
jgi:hypothetical protein